MKKMTIIITILFQISGLEQMDYMYCIILYCIIWCAKPLIFFNDEIKLIDTKNTKLNLPHLISSQQRV